MLNPKMKNIEHIVVLMLENRGFDHLMGWLYHQDEQNRINFIRRKDDQRDFIGLSTLQEEEFESLANISPLNQYQKIPIIKGASSAKIPSNNPGEHFVHIMGQMWGQTNSQVDWADKSEREAQIKQIQSLNASKNAPMNGYALDYAEVLKGNSIKLDLCSIGEILQTYEPQQVPVLSGLAKFYAISDEWFCSVPSQTNTNRAFSTAGTSRGLVTNNFYDAYSTMSQSLLNPGITAMSVAGKLTQGHGGSHSDQLPIDTRNIFSTMSEHKKDWTVFWQDPWPPQDVSLGKQFQYVKTMFPELKQKEYKNNFVQFNPNDRKNPLFKQAREGELPAVSWIEPKWGGGPSWTSSARQVGNDMHPVCDTTIAEDFVANLYTALSSSAKWDKTLFIITFDENGGTYDHVSPPAISPSHLDRAPRFYEAENLDPTTRTEFGFEFNQLGIRVPTIFASPHIKRGTVVRSTQEVVFDHTSLIATILCWLDIDKKYWQLGKRVNDAPMFDSIFQLDKARAEYPPSSALNVNFTQPTFRNPVNPIKFGEKVYLQFVGSKWPKTVDAAKYLAAAEWSTKGMGWYPVLTDIADKAIQIKFVPIDDSQDMPILTNMTNVKIMTEENAVGNKKFLGAFHNSKYLYYASTTEHSGENWQLRSFSSRDSATLIANEDEIYLVSQLDPNLMQGISERITPDPLQRMTVTGEDSKYLTSRAGEWAIWKVLRELPQTDDSL